jgi:hypothetical protein
LENISFAGSLSGSHVFLPEDSYGSIASRAYRQLSGQSGHAALPGWRVPVGSAFSLAEQHGWRRPERVKRANGHNPGIPVPAVGGELVPLIRIELGRLSQIATEAEDHLIAANVPFFQRGSQLVRPVIQQVSASDERKTKTTALVPVSERYMRDLLCRTITWQKYVRREREWIQADAPKDVAETILDRVGGWRFAPVNGVITTSTLRSDGSVLQQPGYDPKNPSSVRP